MSRDRQRRTTFNRGDQEIVEIGVLAPEEAEDEVALAMSRCGTLGIWIEPGIVRGYFRPSEGSRRAVQAAWRAETGRSCPYEMTSRTVDPIDWRARWRAAVRPERITNRLWVAPPAAPPRAEAAPGARIVWIEPGLGFGTGGHPTTRALLAWLDRSSPFDRVLDVGTGSGVLALAAIALGTRAAFGLDTDPHALANAAGNRSLNGEGSRLALIRGSLDALDPGTAFDCVLANLDSDTLPGLMPGLAAHCAPGGRVGVAGALREEGERLATIGRGSGLALVESAIDPDPTGDGAWWSGWFARDRR